MVREYFLCNDGGLKRLSLHMASADILQASVNCSCSCTLHDVMEITNGEPCMTTLCYGQQPNVISRHLDFCYIIIKKYVIK